MKGIFKKLYGGILEPANQKTKDEISKIQNEALVEIEWKTNRNPKFHAKVFKFFRFCFAHVDATLIEKYQFMDEEAQFDGFRKDLTILAGYHVQYVRLNGEIRTEAKSLSFSEMTQEEFEHCYSALINAAMKHIFRTTDEETFNQLVSFF